MSTQWFSVRDKNDTHIAWTAYSNSADVWCGGAFEKLHRRDEYAPRLGEWQCQAHPLRHDPHPIVWVTVTNRHPEADPIEEAWPVENHRMKWCETCLCIVPPPFDGYVYHDYGCPMGRECRCRQ